MKLPKFIIICSVLLFGLIIFLSLFKKKEKKLEVSPQILQELPMQKIEEESCVDSLFSLDSSRSPLVETVVYTNRVPWMQGKNAWISDYASHYKTTRHFIARSLNKKLDYYTQKVSLGDRFNVLKEDVSFYLVIDLSKAKMRFYGIDNKNNKHYFIKTYNVGLGRKDEKKHSGYLTPKGKYLLGDNVAIYKPKVIGYFQDQKIEMIKIFGTRWIPFEKEIENCTDNPKGYGLHGAPWVLDKNTDQLKEDRDKVGSYDSDGCIRLYQEDIEELFAIIISRPTIIDIVEDFEFSKIPGEKGS